MSVAYISVDCWHAQVAIEHGRSELATMLGGVASGPCSQQWLAELNDPDEIELVCSRNRPHNDQSIAAGEAYRGVSVFMDDEFPCNLSSLLGKLDGDQLGIPHKGSSLLMKGDSSANCDYDELAES